MTKKRTLRNVEAVAQMKAGEHKSQTRTVVGFSDAESQGLKQLERKNGDTWEEKDSTGKTICWWEMIDGIKIKYNVPPDVVKAMHDVRDYLNSFPNCPKEKCTCTAPKSIDLRFKRFTGMCEDCTISYETSLKIRGEFGAYAIDRMRQNAEAYFADADREVESIKNALRQTSMLSGENGATEQWTHEGLESYLEEVDRYYKSIKDNVFVKLNGPATDAVDADISENDE